jgi:hypothetical protein
MKANSQEHQHWWQDDPLTNMMDEVHPIPNSHMDVFFFNPPGVVKLSLTMVMPS